MNSLESESQRCGDSIDQSVMSAALSAADVARYNAEGYLLPDPPLRALSTDEAATVRQQIEEVERETGVTANKALFMVRAQRATD